MKSIEVSHREAQENLAQFVNKLISKVQLNQKIIPSIVLEKNKSFRKNSNTLSQSEIMLATKISETPLTTHEILKVVASHLQVEIASEWKEGVSQKKLD